MLCVYSKEGKKAADGGKDCKKTADGGGKTTRKRRSSTRSKDGRPSPCSTSTPVKADGDVIGGGGEQIKSTAPKTKAQMKRKCCCHARRCSVVSVAASV